MKRIPRLPCYTHDLLPVVSDGLNEMNCGVDDEMRMVCAFLHCYSFASLSAPFLWFTVEWSVPQVHSYVRHRVSVKVSNGKLRG